MADKQQLSGFGVFGGPRVSQQDLLRARLAERAQLAEQQRIINQGESTRVSPANAQGFFAEPLPSKTVAAFRRSGAAFGAEIRASRAKNAPLSEDDRRAIRIKEIAKARVGSQLLQPGPGTPGTESDEQKAARELAENDPTTLLKMNLKALSLAAFAEGDLAAGMQFQQDLAVVKDQEIAQAKAQAALGDDRLQRKIDEQELEQAEQDFKESVWDFDQKKLKVPEGDVKNIYTLEGQNLGAGVVREDGSALTKDNKVLGVGTYSIVNPRAGAGGAPTKVNDFITTNAMDGIRKQQEAIGSLMGTAMQGLEAMQDSIDATGTINILGTGGKVASGFVRLIDNVSLLARLVTPEGTGNLEITGIPTLPFQRPPDLNTREGIERYVDTNGAEFAERWQDFIPEHIRRNSAARDKWLSAIVQAGMARARIFEPTAKSLSDDDFQRGLDSIAGATTDPSAFQEVMFGAVTRDLDNYEQAKANLPVNPNTGKSLLDDIVNPAGQTRFNKRVEEFRAAFDPAVVSAGTAEEPGSAFKQQLQPSGQTARAPDGTRFRQMTDGTWEEIKQ